MAAKKKTLKEIFQERFNQMYPGRRLLAIHLDGFTHTVIFDGGTKDSVIRSELYSSFVGKEEASWYGMNNERTVVMFEGFGNSSYQNNPEEIVYVNPEER